MPEVNDDPHSSSRWPSLASPLQVGQAEFLVVVIVDGVVVAQEIVANEPSVPGELDGDGTAAVSVVRTRRQLLARAVPRAPAEEHHVGDGEEAARPVIVLNDQVLARDGVGLSPDRELQVGHGRVAGKAVHADHEVERRAVDRGDHGPHLALGAVDDGGPRVHDGAGGGGRDNVVAELDGIHGHEPVAGPRQIDPINGAVEPGLVVPPEGQLAVRAVA